MQKIFISGNLGQDCEVKNKNNGTKYVQFSVAVSERWHDSQGVKQQRTTWYTCFYDRENVAPYLKKGTKVLVEGNPSCQAWIDKKSGEVVGGMSIRVRELELLSSGEKKEEPVTQKAAASGGVIIDDDDLPF